jgi:hypothetical protein
MLVYGQRLSRDGRLVNLEVGIFCDDTAIGGNDGTLLDLQDIARNDLGGLEFPESAVAKNNGLQSECFLEFIDDRTGLVLLDETDGSVEKQQA